MVRLTAVVGRTTSQSRRSQSGMVTAELAMAIPGLLLVTSLLLVVIGTASDFARASDAARSAARAASIGTEEDLVLANASRLAPHPAEVTLTFADGWATATVSVPPRRWGPLALPAPTVTATAPLEAGLEP